jgi:putative transposase
MPRHHPAALRREACDRMLGGEPIKEVSESLGVSSDTLYKWRRQALIDVGRRPGVKSHEADPLQQARRRIKELEAELKIVKDASAIFEAGVVDPKEVPGCPKAEQPGLLRASGLCGRRARPVDLLRHQVPQADRSRDPPPPSD